MARQVVRRVRQTLMIRRRPTKKNPVKVVFVCTAGHLTSKAFAETFEKYLEMRRPELKKLFNVQYAGPDSSNPNIASLKKADFIYSTLPLKGLAKKYRKHQKFNLLPYAQGRFEHIPSITVLKVLDDVPKDQIAKRLDYFFDSVIRKASQKFGLAI